MSDAPRQPNDEPADDLAVLFGQMAARERPPASGEAAAYAALHAQWRSMTAARRRRRMTALAFAAAASLAVTAGGYFWLQTPAATPPAAVATIERLEGDDVTWRDDRSQARPLGQLRDFKEGQRLATGAGSRLALRWHDGGSLRLDSRSRLEFVSTGAVRLTAGSLYFDSAVAREEADSAPKLAVHTPAGEVVHIGTQFMVSVDGDEVVLSVREGQVKVTGDGFEIVVDTNEQLDLRAEGARGVAPISSYERRWAWAAEIAPPAELDGRTAFDVVAWAARETGRRVVYRTPTAETHARDAVLRGIEAQPPARILKLLSDLTDLGYEIRDDAVVVSGTVNRSRLAAVLLCVVAHGAFGQGAAELVPNAPVGRSVSVIVDELRAAGMPLAYSTTVLAPSLTVQAPPTANDPVAIVREILAPHGLTLRFLEGLYIVVRAAPEADAAAVTGTVMVTVRDSVTGAFVAAPTTAEASSGLAIEALADGRLRLSGSAERRYGITLTAQGFAPARISVPISAEPSELVVELAPLPAVVPEIIVTASRYEVVRELVTAPFYIDQRAIEQLPDFGDDPLRALHRLPGAAAGISAQAHMRGGELNETAVVLNGQRLLDPFHIRDYQNMFSAIDARAIAGMEVYAGGFPVRYGDKIGALVLVDALDPQEPSHNELGLSALSTSVLSAGTIGDGTGSWLVSGRRSNLEDVVHERLGEPAYYDLFGELGISFSERTHVSINALTARDDVLLVTEADPTELEQSINDTSNNHFWVHWQQQWSAELASSTTFSSSAFHSTRRATTNDPEKIVAAVRDERDIGIAGVRQDWQRTMGAAHTLSWGGEYQQQRADYDYSAAADYFGFFLTFPDVPETLRRSATLSPDGELFAVYVADRWQITPATTAELGLRWDKHAYTDTPTERQLSPRISVRHELTANTALRWSLGRYFQSQGLHELQVEDGVSAFQSSQRADHAVVGLEWRLGESYLIRAEVYAKALHRLRPRYENLFDPLAILPELEPDRVRVAPDRGSARGVELSVAYAEPDGLRWWASYVHARATDSIEGDVVPRSWDQRVAAQAGVGRAVGHWDLGAVLSYHSGWPTTGLTLEESPAGATAVVGPRNALRLGGYASLDWRASRSLPLRVGALDVFFEMSNATNRDNPCCVDFDLEEDINGEFLEQETDMWLPRLATFGVLWQF